MISLIDEHLKELNKLCREHHVRRLEVFGSAADGTFDPSRSDLDFLVDFMPLPEGRYANTYFGLLHDLEDLFDRKIDLVMERAIRNPFFYQGVNRSRRVIYVA